MVRQVSANQHVVERRHIEKGPAIKGSDAGPQNARAGEAGTGTRSGRKAGDVHRPTNVTALEFASSIIA